ncbi:MULTISPECIES: hypothetical protein [unclassified Micromonospora]|uniref:hypothetical protein n=1 Tax=unclassified Micromonospora TaxID=2617518 RepID=UPI0036259E43
MTGTTTPDQLEQIAERTEKRPYTPLAYRQPWDVRWPGWLGPRPPGVPAPADKTNYPVFVWTHSYTRAA